MVDSSVPIHLSREMSDYTWPLWCAVTPAVATCTVKSRPPPLHSLFHSLNLCQRYALVYFHYCSTVIYYTYIAMKTYLIHDVYCSWKMSTCQLKEQTTIGELTKKSVTWGNCERKGSFFFSADLVKNDHVLLLSVPTKHVYQSALTEVKRSGLYTEDRPK